MGEDCGVSFRSKDVADLRQKLEHLIRNPEVVRSFEGRARERIRQQYSWERVAKNTETVYLDLVSGKKPA